MNDFLLFAGQSIEKHSNGEKVNQFESSDETKAKQQSQDSPKRSWKRNKFDFDSMVDRMKQVLLCIPNRLSQFW